MVRGGDSSWTAVVGCETYAFTNGTLRKKKNLCVRFTCTHDQQKPGKNPGYRVSCASGPEWAVAVAPGQMCGGGVYMGVEKIMLRRRGAKKRETRYVFEFITHTKSEYNNIIRVTTGRRRRCKGTARG